MDGMKKMILGMGRKEQMEMVEGAVRELGISAMMQLGDILMEAPISKGGMSSDDFTDACNRGMGIEGKLIEK
tara:strand:+ start:349 stop:564 length:216 start_codon:yes stop_codon:yes gene_type:complete